MLDNEKAPRLADGDGTNHEPVPTACAPYLNALKSTNSPSLQETRYFIEGSGTRVRLYAVSPYHAKCKGGGTRAPITKFSRQSRKHMMLACAAVPWIQVPKERCFYVRVTHRYVTNAMRQPKECLARLRKRLRDYFGKNGYSAFWKQEFTSGGNWHLQMLLVIWRLPSSLAKKWNIKRDDELPAEFLGKIQSWIARTWCSALGMEPGDRSPDGLCYCEHVDTVIGTALYMCKGPYARNGKGYQTILPPGVESSGQWWGLCGRELQQKRSVEVSAQEFYDARRFLKKEMESRPKTGYVPRIFSRLSGMDLAVGGGDRTVYDRMIEYFMCGREAA